MAYTAAGMYAAAAIDGIAAWFIPGDPPQSLATILGALCLAILIAALGPRMPRRGLALLGPVGVILIGVSLSVTAGAGDGAVLYLWPVLWTSFYFGRRGAIAIVVCVAVTHAMVLLALPASSSYPGRWIDVMISTVVVAAVVQMLAHRNDELLHRLAGEARTDELTGLLNRRGFDERVELELARAARDGLQVALAAVDIDHFKHVNDEWGHAIGDLVLAQVGAVLSRLSRDIDVVARLGGEEFVVLLPGGSSEEAERFTRRIRVGLAYPSESKLPTVRVSAGVAAARAPASVEPLLAAADRALYAAKRAGRDRTIVCRPEAGAPIVESASDPRAGVSARRTSERASGPAAQRR